MLYITYFLKNKVPLLVSDLRLKSEAHTPWPTSVVKLTDKQVIDHLFKAKMQPL